MHRLIAIHLILFGTMCLGSCQTHLPFAWPRTGVIRGNVILEVNFPYHDTLQEGISVNKDRGISRSFMPLDRTTKINRATLPGDLWQKVEQLRQEWCTRPPPYATSTPEPESYEVIVKCEGGNPIYTIAPDQLPESIMSLIQFVPSTTSPDIQR